MFELFTIIITSVIISIVNKITSNFAKKFVSVLLFDGAIRDEHRTTYVLNEITERYKESITSINYALYLNVGFAFIALYAYIILPPTGLVEIPFIGLSVSKQIWISLVPAISYSLQILIIMTFIWFILLRLSLRILGKERDAKDDFGDVTNVVLNGPISYIWIAFRIGKFFDSRWNYLWYVPTVALVAIIVFSPLFICLYFIIELFGMGSIWLGLIYGIIFFPFSAMFLLLLVTSLMLGIGEWWIRLETEGEESIELKTVELVSKLYGQTVNKKVKENIKKVEK
jgi:hypothetical protein